MMLKIQAMFSRCCRSVNNRDIEIDMTENSPDPENPKGSGSSSYGKRLLLENGQLEEDDASSGPQLKLIAIEGTLIPVDTEFTINVKGLADGGRGKNDGETYIGSKQDQGLNDIVIGDSSVGGQHCMIRYDREKKMYYLHDLGEGSGTFFKIEKELELKSGYIISFSDSHMLVHTRDIDVPLGSEEERPAQDDKKGNITIKFLDGPKVDQVFKFKAEDKMIKIGRMADCQIKFDDNNLSRYQCTFKLVNNGWYIVDGFRGKSSTNGTWLLVENRVELPHETVIKIGQTLFKVEIGPGSQ